MFLLFFRQNLYVYTVILFLGGETMIQVKVLIETDEEELEEVVNSFLEDMDELEVLSIQYSMSQVLVDEEIETTYGAMIIYRLEIE